MTPAREPGLDGTLTALVVAMSPTGSRTICDPPPTDTDDDYIVHTSDLAAFTLAAEALGYAFNDASDVPLFTSCRKGEVNLIVTASADFYARFVAATHVAKRLNLRIKDDRIALFQAVLYAKCWPEGVVSLTRSEEGEGER